MCCLSISQLKTQIIITIFIVLNIIFCTTLVYYQEDPDMCPCVYDQDDLMEVIMKCDLTTDTLEPLLRGVKTMSRTFSVRIWRRQQQWYYRRQCVGGKKLVRWKLILSITIIFRIISDSVFPFIILSLVTFNVDVVSVAFNLFMDGSFIIPQSSITNGEEDILLDIILSNIFNIICPLVDGCSPSCNCGSDDSFACWTSSNHRKHNYSHQPNYATKTGPLLNIYKVNIRILCAGVFISEIKNKKALRHGPKIIN